MTDINDERDVIRCAREFLADEKRWTKRVSYRNAAGDGVGYIKTRVVSCCLYGALEKCVLDAGGGLLDRRLQRAVNSVTRAIDERTDYYRELTSFNDAHKTTHADVLAVLDEGLALAEADHRAPQPEVL